MSRAFADGVEVGIVEFEEGPAAVNHPGESDVCELMGFVAPANI